MNRVSDPIDKYLDDIPDLWKAITIHQLLSHTSGLMHSWALPEFEKTIMIPATPEQTLAKFNDKPLVSKPGEAFLYSGLGYFILTRVIATRACFASNLMRRGLNGFAPPGQLKRWISSLALCELFR